MGVNSGTPSSLVRRLGVSLIVPAWSLASCELSFKCRTLRNEGIETVLTPTCSSSEGREYRSPTPSEVAEDTIKETKEYLSYAGCPGVMEGVRAACHATKKSVVGTSEHHGCLLSSPLEVNLE